MILEYIKQENWYEIMVLFLAVAYSQRNEDHFFFNSFKVAQFFEEKKDIRFTRYAVNRCIERMCEKNYVKIAGRLQLTKKDVITIEEYYKTDNIYEWADLNAINEDLKQYWWGSGKDWLDDPDALMNLWFEFSTNYNNFEEKPKESIEADIESDPKKEKVEKALESRVNRICIDMLKDNNEFALKILESTGVSNPEKYIVTYLEQIRLRETNAKLCSTRNPSNYDDNDKRHYDTARKEILEPYLGKGYIEFDINCCVPRLQKDLLNDEPAPFYRYDSNGNYLLKDDGTPVTDDIYERIYNRAGFNSIRYIRENVSDIWLEISGKYIEKISVRDIVKALTLPLFMREGYYGNSISQYYKWIYSNSDITLNKLFYNYLCLEVLFNLPIKVIIKRWKNAMHQELAHPEKKITTFLRSDIFLYESNLEIIMVNNFNKLGIRCLNVYDGFYFPEGAMTPELFYQVYVQSLKYLKQLMKEFNEPVENRLKRSKIVELTEKDYKMPNKKLIEEYRCKTLYSA